MKCVCNYEYNSEIDKPSGDEPFIHLTTIKTSEQKSGYGHKLVEFTPLFACPRCGTVKINLVKEAPKEP